ADPARLPAAEQALRERLRLSASGIGSYATDRNATMAAFTLGGRLYRADLIGGSVTEVECAGTAAGSVVDPRPDPGGRRIAYVSAGKLRVATVDPANPAGSSDALIAGEEGIDWGLAEFIAAEEFGRYRGYWWAPDGGSLLAARVDESRVPRWTMHDPALPDAVPRSVAYPYAGAANAQVSLHLLDLEGGWVDVHWDRETYPYLAVVSWLDGGGPLIGVLRRLQQHGLVLAVDARTGETQVHAELADPRWVDGIPGTPMYLPDGRVLVGGELAHDGYDARCLFADGTLLTPPGLYVRRVCGRVSAAGAGGEAAGGTDLLVEASEGEPSEQYLYRVTAHPGAPVVDATRVQLAGVGSAPGWHVGFGGGETIVVGSQSLDHPGVRWSVHRAGGQYAGELTNLAATPPYAPRPLLQRVTDRRLPTGVLYPRSHVAGRKLPVLVDVYGGPSHQEVVATRARWLARQWWADAGFAVVVVDNRGTSGVSPSFEKVIHRRMADVALTDQVEALRALAEKHVDLDLDRVAIRGWSYGGWLAGLAALRRPDTYHAAVLGAPVTDWRLYDTAYTERYLGLPGDGSDVYEHHSLIALAEQPPARPQDARPMLLIHGLADDNVVSAHTLRLSAALLFAGRPHAVLPLTGASHMAAGVSEPLLRLELDFVRRALG
ncbi:MAG: S9 family peptidase, partial [Micromonosporaceae bacterium]|nr:S9 family peptidase [Micromonosporaceae bacterium]